MRQVKRSSREFCDWGEHLLLELKFGRDDLCRRWMEECYLSGTIDDYLEDVSWARK